MFTVACAVLHGENNNCMLQYNAKRSLPVLILTGIGFFFLKFSHLLAQLFTEKNNNAHAAMPRKKKNFFVFVVGIICDIHRAYL